MTNGRPPSTAASWMFHAGRGLAWLILAILLQRMYWLEALHYPWWRSAALTAAFVTGGFALTGRWLAGGYVGVLGFLALRGASRAKFAVLQQPLTAADVRDLTLMEAWQLTAHYPVHAMALGLLLVAAVWGMRWLMRRPRRARGAWRGVAIVLTGGALASAAQGLEEVSIGSVSPESVSVLNFMSTFFDEPPHLVSSLPPQVVTPTLVCPPAPPDVFLVLEESTFRPTEEDVQALAARPFFEGNLFAGELRVHVVGGMTHLSEFAVLTGVPHVALRGENTFPQVPLEGKVRHSLPQLFKDCGYDTTVLYPTPRAFRNSARWYQSLGFEQLLSGDDTQVPDWRVRDAHFYAHALKQLDDSPPSRPQLVYALTIAQHGPHGSGDLHAEYLRRLQHSAQDWAELRQRLVQRSAVTGRPWILAWFGDHRPWGIGTDGPHRKVTWGTIQRLEGSPFGAGDSRSPSPERQAQPAPEAGPQPGQLDLAFFGRRVMQAAGVSFRPVADLQDQLIATCPAEFLKCDAPLRDRYVRALLDSHSFLMP